MSTKGCRRVENSQGRAAGRYTLVLAVLMAGALLCGCGGVKQMVSATSRDEAPFVQEVPVRAQLSEGDLADDIKLVAGTLLLRMYLETDLPSEVVFSPRGSHRIHDTSFAYEGFWLQNMDLLNYEAELVGKDTASVDLSGIFHFRDFVGRKTSASFRASYLVTPTRVTVESSEVRPIQPSFPEVQCFFVPREALQAVAPGSLDDFTSWYAFALANAETMTPTPAERETRQRYEQMSFFERMKNIDQTPSQEYLVLVFSMERILDNGALMVNMSQSRYDRPEHLTEARLLDESGWSIAALGADMALDSPAKKYFVQVFYTPDCDLGSDTPYPVLVGLFASEKNYDPPAGGAARPAATASTSAPAAQPAQGVAGGPGPFESGREALDPRDMGHAKLIQARLAELGFYTMAVDGKFGKGSYGALQAFKRARGLPDDVIWDMPTQKALFRGSGR